MTQMVDHEEQAQDTSDSLNPNDTTPTPRCQDSIPKDTVSQLDFLNFPSISTSVPELLPQEVPSESLEQLNVDTLMMEAFRNTVTLENVSETTSLCSWAFSLVLKNNSKGYSAADLDFKLRAGYRFGAVPTEGCRIDNKILLNVLAEIS